VIELTEVTDDDIPVSALNVGPLDELHNDPVVVLQ
jgi:hypothetical protein